MIKEVIVTNSSGEQLPLTLKDPDSSGLIVIDIQGLGPGKSTINTRENTLVGGSTFNSAKTPSRNIVLTLRFLQGNSTIEATRLRTYRYFPNESRVRLDIVTDADTYHIYGYVESNEPTIFSKAEGAVISILCPDPFFRTEDGTNSQMIESIAHLFSFPFGTVESAGTIIFGERFFQNEDFVIPLVSKNGTPGSVNVAPTFILYAVGGQVNNPRIKFYNPNNPLEVQILGFTFTTALPKLEDGDYLTIVCEKQNKSVTRFVANTGRLINYIGAVSFDSVWPILHPGDNLFSYDAADNSAMYIRLGYEFALQYSGV